MPYVFDIETNGLLYKAVDRRKRMQAVADRVHCLACKELATGELYAFGPNDIEQGLTLLQDQLVIGHNVLQYDLPLLAKLYGFTYDPHNVIDTLVVSRLAYPDLELTDIGRVKAGRLPGRLAGSHGLKAWGYRLGYLKGEFAEQTDWSTYSDEMLEYCKNDVELNAKLYDKFVDLPVSPDALHLEHAVSYIISKQEAKGVLLDTKRVERLVEDLSSRRYELDAELSSTMDDIEKVEWFTPKRDNRTKGYRKGVPYKKVKIEPFNVQSSQHIAYNLKKRGWKPTEYTPSGQPKIDETVLADVGLPEAKLLSEYLLVNKRLAQVSEGPTNWLRMLDQTDGRVHGQVNTLGTVSGRMSHNNPNLAQVPAGYSPYGQACRECWIVPPGWKLVGCDADGLEMRGLGHFLVPYDDGLFIESATSGSKEDGTDPHSRNAKLASCGRDTAKTLFYAFLYGAGNAKLGAILGGDAKLGKQVRERLEHGITGLDKLLADIGKALKARNGKLKGLDGRWLYCRSEHAALNLVIQSAGGLIMKKALCLLYERLVAELPANSWYFVLNVHDEFQLEVREELAERVALSAEQAIVDAGVELGFKCPLAASSALGRNWYETH